MAVVAKQTHDLPKVILDQLNKLDQDITTLRGEVQESRRRFIKFHPNLKFWLLVFFSATSVLAGIIGVNMALNQ